MDENLQQLRKSVSGIAVDFQRLVAIFAVSTNVVLSWAHRCIAVADLHHHPILRSFFSYQVMSMFLQLLSHKLMECIYSQYSPEEIASYNQL